MASVTFQGLWVNDGSDLSDFRHFDAGKTTSFGASVAGEVRTYAGGRRRVISSVGSPVQWAFSLTWVSQADLAWLEARMGALVLVRDEIGRAVWGTYLGLSVTDYVGRTECQVDVSLESVSHETAV